MFFLLFYFLGLALSNPLNFTHRVLISFSVDGEPKGEIAVGLWRDDAPKAVDNFLALCMGHTPHKLKSGHKLDLKNKRVYQIQKDEYLLTGDMSPNYNWEGNETIFSDENGKYTRESTFFSIEPGVLMLEAKEGEYGKVGSEFKFYLKRYEYHFIATVFGQVYRNLDLLFYLSKTAGDNDAQPRREVFITECKINREDVN
jgi:cyclophilin family peptidyl-prolyl cis-trans isomerase